MDYQTFLEFCKDKIVEAEPTVEKDDLEAFWQGTLMEMSRMLFRLKNSMTLYQVTYNTVTEASDVVRYNPETL